MGALEPMQDNLVPVFDAKIGGEVQQCVDARTLHKWLKNGDMFANWIKSRIKTYGFVENIDYSIVFETSKTIRKYGKSTRKGIVKRTEYLLTLDMAKELSMVENNEQGRMARRYFINCEKVLRKAAFSLMNQFNRASLEFDRLCEIASNAGRTLSIVGKQHKPKSKRQIDELKTKLQPMLNFFEPENEKADSIRQDKSASSTQTTKKGTDV